MNSAIKAKFNEFKEYQKNENRLIEIILDIGNGQQECIKVTHIQHIKTSIGEFCCRYGLDSEVKEKLISRIEMELTKVYAKEFADNKSNEGEVHDSFENEKGNQIPQIESFKIITGQKVLREKQLRREQVVSSPIKEENIQSPFRVKCTRKYVKKKLKYSPSKTQRRYNRSASQIKFIPSIDKRLFT